MPGKDELSQSVKPCGEKSLSPASSTIHTRQCTPGTGPVSRGLGSILTYKERFFYVHDTPHEETSCSAKDTRHCFYSYCYHKSCFVTSYRCFVILRALGG